MHFEKGRIIGSEKYKSCSGNKLSDTLSEASVKHDILQDCTGSASPGHGGHGG